METLTSIGVVLMSSLINLAVPDTFVSNCPTLLVPVILFSSSFLSIKSLSRSNTWNMLVIDAYSL